MKLEMVLASLAALGVIYCVSMFSSDTDIKAGLALAATLVIIALIVWIGKK